MTAASLKKVAPWPDYAGNTIHDGDLIKHPVSGQLGLVKYCDDIENDKWRVHYGDGFLSHLCLQIGDKGQAVVCNDLTQVSFELLLSQNPSGARIFIENGQLVTESLQVPV